MKTLFDSQNINDGLARTVFELSIENYEGYKRALFFTTESKVISFLKEMQDDEAINWVECKVEINEKFGVPLFLDPSYWEYYRAIKAHLIKRMKVGAILPLKYWDVEIRGGILTGYNDAFIINGTKARQLSALLAIDKLILLKYGNN